MIQLFSDFNVLAKNVMLEIFTILPNILEQMKTKGLALLRYLLLHALNSESHIWHFPILPNDGLRKLQHMHMGSRGSNDLGPL